MEKFDLKIRIYDKHGCCIYICGFNDFSDAIRRYNELERENPSSEWYIELSQAIKKNKR